MEQINLTPPSSKDLKARTRLGAGFLIVASVGSGVFAVAAQQYPLLVVSGIFSLAAYGFINRGGRQIEGSLQEEARVSRVASLSGRNNTP